jgi:predicted DNA-binding protein
MKLPNQDKSEVFVMRMSKKNKQQLEELAKRSKFGNNSSEVVRYLIESAYLRL